MSFLINPYAFLAAGGDFESIATVTVGSGGASSIEFTSIPGTYQHLQVRGILRTDRSGTSGENVRVTLNGASSTYAWHELAGDGASPSASAASSQNYMIFNRAATSASNASVFGAFVLDLLDYASASKASTTRIFGGMDNNGSGIVSLCSGLWTTTDTITSIKFTPNNGPNYVQHSTLALYGIKAP